MKTTHATPATTASREGQEGGGALILRDHLAIDRTVLANERTLLAYGRTTLTLLIVGFSLLHVPLLQPGGPGTLSMRYWLGAGLFVAASVAVAIVGLTQYVRCRRRLNAIRGPAGVASRHEGYWSDPPAAG